MKFKKSANRLVPLGKRLLFCCIMLGLMTALSSAAAPEKDVCTGADMGSYAKLVFCLPPQVVVEPETMEEADYTGGREVAASMLLDGKRVGLHLLYPCIAPQKELEPAELKPFLEAFNPVLSQANYNDSVTGPVLWGQVGNQIFVAYQPNNLTIALVLMDINMSEQMMTAFLGNLSISLNEGTTPITPGYCPDTTVATAEAPVQNNATVSPATEETTPAETRTENLATGKEKMISDMEAARAKLEAAREKMKNF